MNRGIRSLVSRGRKGALAGSVRAGVVLALLGLSLLALPEQAAAAGWSPTGSLVTPRDSNTATLLTDGKVLVAGGSDSGVPLASAELYDPATGTFSATGSMGTARFNHTATLLPNGKVLVAGGQDGAGNLASAELYDPATGTFSVTGSLGTARYNPSAILLRNGKVLVSGGRDNRFGGFSLASAELYNPASGTFSSTGSMRAAREWHMLALLPNGKVLVSGGSTTDGFGTLLPLSSAELYDPATGLFSFTGSMGVARFNPTATLLESGKVLVAGGVDFDIFGNPIFHSSAELYAPAAGTFSATGSMAFTVFNGTATRLPDGKVLFAGGHPAVLPPSPTNAAQLYDPVTGTFSLTFPMSDARHSHYATDSKSTLLHNGKVLVAGGIGSGGLSLASAELFAYADTNPPVWSTATLTDTNPSGKEGDVISFTIQATDADGDTVTYSHTGLPAFCSLNASTGAVECTPGSADAGTYPVDFRASDGGAVASPDPLSYTISVENVGTGGGGGGGGCNVAVTHDDWDSVLNVYGVLILLICSVRVARYFLRGGSS